MSRARQVANFDPALFAADEVSGDKVHGGTISGSPVLVTPNIGTVTEGNLANTAIVYPTGHVVKHSIVRHPHSGAGIYFTIPFSGSAALVDFGSSKTLQLTGVTATEGNLLLISTGGFSWYSTADNTYATDLAVRIDGTIGGGLGSNFTHNPYTQSPVYFQVFHTVPASFTSKTIEFYAWKQTSHPGTSRFDLASSFGDVEAFVSVLEIQV